jgi:hypothetical protein
VAVVALAPELSLLAWLVGVHVWEWPTARQHDRLTSVLDADEHFADKVAWSNYQKDHRRLRRPRPALRQTRHEQADRLDPPQRAAGLEEIANSVAPCGGAATTSWPFSTTTPSTDPPKPSMAAWKPCAATPPDSETSGTTAGAHCCTAAQSARSSMHCEVRSARLSPNEGRVKRLIFS